MQPCLLQAAELHKAGQLSAAEQTYAAAVRIDPRNAACLHGLGVLTFQLHGLSQVCAAAIAQAAAAAAAEPPAAPVMNCTITALAAALAVL
jgi:hypothetical protein